MPEDLLLFLTIRIKKMSVWKTIFVPEHSNTDQSQLTTCFALHALPVAVLAILANSAAQANHITSAKHIVDYLSHAFFLTCAHLY